MFNGLHQLTDGVTVTTALTLYAVCLAIGLVGIGVCGGPFGSRK